MDLEERSEGERRFYVQTCCPSFDFWAVLKLFKFKQRSTTLSRSCPALLSRTLHHELILDCFLDH
jgi:hypothetical protein